MSAAQSANVVSREVAEQAVNWLLTLQEEGRTPALLREWTAWREAAAEHEAAWQRIESLHGRLQQVQDMAPASAQSARSALMARNPSRRRRAAIATLLGLVFAGGAAWMVHDNTTVRRWTAQVRTGKGERWQQTLDDGTILSLAGASALNLRFDQGRRVVELLAGEVFVQTGHAVGETRPFLVLTRYGSAQALGTQYSVRLPDDAGRSGAAAQVTVFEGQVRLMADHAPAEDTLVLHAGQQALLFRQGYGEVQAADDNRANWSRGMLIARGMRLADFLRELDPHVTFALDCDPRVADLGVSGSYPLDRPEDVLHSLARMLDLAVDEQRRGWWGRALYLRPRT